MHKSREINFARVFRRLPTAVAVVRGSEAYPTVNGTVKFYETPYGVVVAAEIAGLPVSTRYCAGQILALHIHEGDACTGNVDDPFANAGGHYNPRGCPHPYHAGDLPPLLVAGVNAFLAVLTDRFTVDEVVGRTVIIHGSPDDFTTQPAGNAGRRIACGEIAPVRR